MTTDLPTRGTAHHENYLRYKAKVDAEPQPFTASQQRTPLQYLPYASYPLTPKEPAMHIMSAAELTAAFKAAPTGIYQRRIERTVTLHEDEDGTSTLAVLSVSHDKDSKQFSGAVRIVRNGKPDGPFRVTSWIPFERTHNRRLPSIPVSRYSDKALMAADSEALDLLTAEPDWLDNLDLGPYKGDL